ncbi:HAMP domain-containing sensor histidine kinase [Clostridium sediminicola]|uniref:sensor histidine kinase n=1 Tax=Clostridium sediminicola TaxID=3114879 RepID=UPI0031F22D08
MTIRSRLKYSHVAMVLVPVLLVSLLIAIARLHYINNYQKPLSNTFEKINIKDIPKIAQPYIRKLNNIIVNNPDKLQDVEFLDDIDDVLLNIDAGIVVMKNEDEIYNSEIIEGFNYKKHLNDFGKNTVKNSINHSEFENELHLVQQEDFYFTDGSTGSIAILCRLDSIISQVNKISIIIFLFVIIILIATHRLITYFVSKGIVDPLNKLRIAANEIKEGNLDYEVNINTKDEIGELYQSFEEMRIRLKESLLQQQQYEENRKELISNISHDLKTPITSINGYIQGIRDGIADTPEKMERYINTISAKADNMDKLIEELFLFSKLDLKRVPFNFQKVNMTDYLKDCVEEVSFDLNKNEIELQFIYEEKNIFVMADPQQLKRVILNIITNGTKYLDKDRKGKLKISLEEKEEKVIVAISDNGIGISKDMLPFIFDRFYRGDSSRNSTTGGSGLGLAISKNIIEEHKGEIWVESTLGKGTTIMFTLFKYGG